MYVCIYLYVSPELSGLDIEGKHCEVEYRNEEVFLTPLNGSTCINTGTIYDKTKLTHGELQKPI